MRRFQLSKETDIWKIDRDSNPIIIKERLTEIINQTLRFPSLVSTKLKTQGQNSWSWKPSSSICLMWKETDTRENAGGKYQKLKIWKEQGNPDLEMKRKKEKISDNRFSFLIETWKSKQKNQLCKRPNTWNEEEERNHGPFLTFPCSFFPGNAFQRL